VENILFFFWRIKMRLHYLQHVPFENPGSILTWAEENNCNITSTHFYDDEKVPKHNDYDWLVVMGGPMNIYDENNYSWLADEKLFIREAVNSGKVVIGICLGAQLIADVIGGKVTENPYLEIGWYPITLSQEARDSTLFSFFPKQPTVFHWHGDTFSKLPEDAICIAENNACSHQAFIYKKKVFGFQFHLENTEEIIKNLLIHSKDEMVPGTFVQTQKELLLHPEYIKQDNKLMDMFLTQLKRIEEEGG
jgi:GMP synthase-like glutamine amidotransferase